MPRKVEPPRRDQTAWIVGPAPGGEWINKERVAEIAKKHNIRSEYDLHTALDHAITWYLLETSRQKDGPTLEQRRLVFRQIDEHAAALESIVANLPFSLYEQITQHALDGGWKSRLLDEVRGLQAAVAPLSEEANKPAKPGPHTAARDHFLEKLICAYEEGAGQPAKVYWNGGKGCYGGAILSFARDCLDLIAPMKEINKKREVKNQVRIIEKNEAGTMPRLFASDQALAEVLKAILNR